MTQSSQAAAARTTKDLPPLKTTEVVLQTARWQEMRRWWDLFLGSQPFFENDQLSFRYIEPSLGEVLAIFNMPHLADKTGNECGLNHVQFKIASIGGLLERYEVLKAAGVVPQQTTNHGPATAFYYRDPDNNRVEISANNFDTPQEREAYISGPVFRANPLGVNIDAEELLADYRAGVPVAELVKLPDDTLERGEEYQALYRRGEVVRRKR
jgi:catechol 2,3-dioxygenase-like lactoylglutathione lyase family enzyme